MRTIQIARLTGAAAGVLVLAAAAKAGTFTPVGEIGGSYSFTTCEQPPPLQIADLGLKKGRVRMKAHREETRRYNEHVSQVNVYLACLSEEAGKDLQIYYNAVSSSLDAEQNRVIDALEEQRKALGEAR